MVGDFLPLDPSHKHLHYMVTYFFNKLNRRAADYIKIKMKHKLGKAKWQNNNKRIGCHNKLRPTLSYQMLLCIKNAPTCVCDWQHIWLCTLYSIYVKWATCIFFSESLRWSPYDSVTSFYSTSLYISRLLRSQTILNLTKFIK